MQKYQKKMRSSARPARAARSVADKAPPMDALRTVTSLSSIERGARRVDLPGAIQAKMENAFGADLSGVKIYESQAVADAGADALAQGSHIAFAPGQLDLVSMHGQALLGHELSHVVSQARGEARGTGLLENHTLESRADREGMMAAMGQSIYPSVMTPGAAAAAAPSSMAGPVQARRRRRGPKPVYGPELPAYMEDQRLGASSIGSDSLGGNILRGVLSGSLGAVEQYNNFGSTAEALASEYDDGSSVLGAFGQRVSKVSNNDIVGHIASGTSVATTLKGAWDTGKEMKDIITDRNKNAGEKILSSTRALSSFGSDAVGTAKNLLGSISKNEALNKTLGTQFEQASGGLQMIAGAAAAIEASIQGYRATSDRLAAERAGRMLASDSETRAQEAAATGDMTKVNNDKLLRSMATNARNAAKVRKAESVQNGINAGMDFGIGAVSFIPGAGNLAALGGSALKAVTNVGLDAHVEQKRKEAREKNLDNLSLRASLEKRLGMQDDLPEKKKNEIRHRAKHLANQMTAGERGAKTNKVAGMHKTQSDISALGALTSQDNAEGVRARGIANAMGIGTNAQGELLSTDSASAQVNADFSRGESAEEQISAADAHQFNKEHTVEAELKRQKNRANEKAEKKAAKRLKKEKKQAAIDHFNSLSEENRQGIREGNRRRKAEKKQMLKDAGIKWYQRSKRKEALLDYDVKHHIGDEYGGHDTSRKEEKLAALREARIGRAQEKENRKQLKAARTEARAADKAYKQERAQKRKEAGIKWYQRSKKKAFNDEYDYQTGTKERPDVNAPAGSATANANLSWHGRAGNYLKNKWYSMRRKHQRARDSFINEQESFDQLSKWRKAKLVMSNPLAYIKSKTKSGKAATAKRNSESAADDHLLEQLMNGEQSVSQSGALTLSNPSVSSQDLLDAKRKLKRRSEP